MIQRAPQPEVNQHWRHIGTGEARRILMVAKDRPSDAEETVFYADPRFQVGAAGLERFIATHWRIIE